MRIYAFLLPLAASLAVAQTPTIVSGGIVNGASFQKGLAITPGSLISIFGTSLASKTAQADSIPLSTSLGGVTVQFVNGSNTVNAPMLYAQPDDPSKNVTSQINLQVPWEIVPSGTSATVNVVVTNNGVASQPTPVSVAPFSPAVFSSGGRAIAQNADGTLVWPAGAIPNLTTHPAKMGDVITIYATGLGAVDSAVADGQNSLDKLRHTVTPPMVLVGGISAEVQFSGLSPQFVGVNQLNVVIPNAAAGDSVPLQIQVGGITSPDSVTIAISQ
ncbi:MAG TPA: hypothetical protein VKV15_08395 [Bryobacteraceae bacterium]|nr:hypothetical protein [Bryobacteraceae bacterium]